MTNRKKIGQPKREKEITLSDALRNTWMVMKPFVQFSIKATKVIAHALIFIVKHIPKPDVHEDRSKNEKVIKVR
jgi:hypothetical protein